MAGRSLGYSVARRLGYRAGNPTVINSTMIGAHSSAPKITRRKPHVCPHDAAASHCSGDAPRLQMNASAPIIIAIVMRRRRALARGAATRRPFRAIRRVDHDCNNGACQLRRLSRDSLVAIDRLSGLSDRNRRAGFWGEYPCSWLISPAARDIRAPSNNPNRNHGNRTNIRRQDPPRLSIQWRAP